MIKSYCSECEAQMVDGVMKHRGGCSANTVPQLEIEVRPPGITLKFDTPEEQAEWLRKLTGPLAKTKASRKQAPAHPNAINGDK